MTDELTCRKMYPGDPVAVSGLTGRVFDQFIAPDYSAVGVAEFRRYIRPEALLNQNLNP